MKPFDLERAKAGDPIVTRDGRNARFIAYIPEAGESYRVVVLIEGKETPCLLDENGRRQYTHDNAQLFMAPTKRDGWVNVYPMYSAILYQSKEMADINAGASRLACCRIEWEE